MQRNRIIIGSTFLFTLLGAATAFAFPVPVSYPLSDIEFYLPFVANIIIAVLYVGAAIVFTTNLDVYTKRLRRAYAMIAISIVLVGLGTLQFSVIAVLDAWRSAYVLGGGMMFPLVLASILLYIALRHLVLLVGARRLLTKVWLAIPFSLMIAYATSFLPHVTVTLSEATFDTGVGVITFSAILLYIAGILAYSIRQHVGEVYQRPMSWLAGALLISGLTMTIQGIYTLVTTDYDHILTRINNLVTIASGILWLRASYSFALTKYYAKDTSMLQFVFSQSGLEISSRPSTAIDLVTYAASLASNSQEIDPLLDDVRAITAKLQPGESPTEHDGKTLFQTYLKIEQYLVTKETVRNYTRNELREHIDPTLQKQLFTYEHNNN